MQHGRRLTRNQEGALYGVRVRRLFRRCKWDEVYQLRPRSRQTSQPFRRTIWLSGFFNSGYIKYMCRVLGLCLKQYSMTVELEETRAKFITSTPKNDCGTSFLIYPQPQHHIPMYRQQYHPHLADTHHLHTTVEVPILAMATTVTTLNHQLIVHNVELIGVLIQSTGSQT